MNSTLEAIGQALFKHWFVDFEFPNEEGKPYRSSGGEMVETELGEMPRGWKISTIDNITSLIIDHRGLTPKKLDGSWVPKGIPAISAKNIKAGRIVQNETIKFIDEELFNLWMKDKLALGDVLLTSEAPLGELLYVASNTNFCLSQRIFCLRANHELCLPIYLYYSYEKLGSPTKRGGYMHPPTSFFLIIYPALASTLIISCSVI